MAAANRTATELQKKTKEVERKKKQQKLRAWERREEKDNDDNDEEEDDEVVADIEWDDPVSEDTLTGIHLSAQGPFSFHVGESASEGPAEMGRTIGLPQEIAGAGRSATTPEVPA